MSLKLKDRLGCPGCFNCLPPVVPAAHPSFPRSLSPALIRERESIPPLTRHSRERGNPYGLDAGLPLDKPKVHGKTGVVAKTKTPCEAGQGVLVVCYPSYPPLTRLSREVCPLPRSGSGNPYVLDVGLSSDKPKVHGKTGVVAKTKTPCEAGQGVLVVCYPSYPPLTRLSREACPRPRSGSGNPSRRSPVIPAEAGIHTYLMLDCHRTSPKCMGKQESSRKLKHPVRRVRAF